MTFEEILQFVGAHWQQGLLYLILFSGIIQISPIKINPWSWIAKKIGKALNGELVKKLEALEKQLDGHIKSDEQYRIENKRVRILSFSDDLQNGAKYSKSHFDQILLDITDYNRYCDAHPDFKNKITSHAAKLIENTYDQLLNDDSFL